MPGFMIDGRGGKVSASPDSDLLRDHRFKLVTFMDKDASQLPLALIKDVDLPEKVVETLEIKCPGTTYKFAKSVSYGDLKLTFYGTKELATLFKELEEKVHTTKNGIADFDEYLKEVGFQMYDGEGSELVNFKFKGCWISNTQWGACSYGSSEIKLITIIVKCNYYEIT